MVVCPSLTADLKNPYLALIETLNTHLCPLEWLIYMYKYIYKHTSLQEKNQ